MFKTLAFSLLLGLVTQIFSSQVLFVGYLINQNFISAELCIKKSEANNSCHGKCHLKKQISKNQESNDDKSTTIKKGVELLYHEAFDLFQFNNTFILNNVIDFNSNNLTRQGYYNKIFHPPLS